MRKYVCSDLKIYTQPDLICPTLAGAGVCSVKVDGVPLAGARETRREVVSDGAARDGSSVETMWAVAVATRVRVAAVTK